SPGTLPSACASAPRPARALGSPPPAGLRSPDTPVTLDVLQGFARVDIANGGVRFRRPLLADANVVAAGLDADDDVVLLGSIASSKYVDVLSRVFGPRLKFPIAVVGRGDMSRGGVLPPLLTAGAALRHRPAA